jgi:ATP-binding cassette subfamily B multidrug efflux pump
MSSEFYEHEKYSPEEEEVGSGRALRFLLPFLKEHRLPLSVCFLLLLCATGLSLYWPILLKKGVDVDIASGNTRGLLQTAVIIALIQVATLLLQYFQRVKLEIIGQNIMLDLKSRVFSHILSLKVSFFDKNPVGRLMARVESDAEALRMLFTNTVVMMLGDIVLVIGIFAVMFHYSAKLASLMAIIFPIIVAFIFIFERKTTPRFFEVRRKMAELTGIITEFLHGMSIIQIFNRGAWAREKVNDGNREKFRHDAYVNIAVILFFNVVFFSQYVMIGVALYFGALWIQSGELTVGILSMFIILVWRTYEPIYRSSEQLSNIQKALAGARRIYALLSNRQILAEPVKPLVWKGLSEGIRFENVWFSYDGAENFVLKNVSFEVSVGRRIALAGVTGGGKSTIISLLLRFYDPQKGRITVDGIDLRDIPKADLRRRFALVLQDIFLFPGDVKSNIALESDTLAHEDVVSAARTVDAERFISRLPRGYDTEISEKGANFSRGERQLLSFARALAVNPDVLILDEATSSVDPETERTIQEALKRLMAGRTSLVIAHRLSTILDVDEILVVRNGEIIERGNHTDLILADGYYAKLFHLQFKSRNGVMTYAG